MPERVRVVVGDVQKPKDWREYRGKKMPGGKVDTNISGPVRQTDTSLSSISASNK